MQRPIRKGLLIAGLGLLTALVGCSSQSSQSNETETVYTLAEIQLISPDLVAKYSDIAGGSIRGGDATSFEPWMPDEINFRMFPFAPTSIDENYFKFRADMGSVDQYTPITADWLGPQGYWGYDMSPHGLNFSQPVQMMIDVTTLVVAAEIPQDILLMLLDNEDGTYSPMEADIRVFDDGHNQRYFLDGRLNHFSKYVIGIGPPPGSGGGN